MKVIYIRANIDFSLFVVNRKGFYRIIKSTGAGTETIENYEFVEGYKRSVDKRHAEENAISYCDYLYEYYKSKIKYN